MAPLETAVKELRQILSADGTAPEWRWNVRRRLSEVKDALSGPQARQADAWLAARAQSSNRVRHQLHARATSLASGVLEKLDTESIAERDHAAGDRPRAPRAAPARPRLRLGVPRDRRVRVAAEPSRCAAWQRGRDSNPRLTSLPATAFKAVPIGHSGTPPGPCEPRPSLGRPASSVSAAGADAGVRAGASPRGERPVDPVIPARAGRRGSRRTRPPGRAPTPYAAPRSAGPRPVVDDEPSGCRRGGRRTEGAHPPALSAPVTHRHSPGEGGHAEQHLERTRYAAEPVVASTSWPTRGRAGPSGEPQCVRAAV